MLRRSLIAHAGAVFAPGRSPDTARPARGPGGLYISTSWSSVPSSMRSPTFQAQYRTVGSSHSTSARNARRPRLRRCLRDPARSAARLPRGCTDTDAPSATPVGARVDGERADCAAQPGTVRVLPRESGMGPEAGPEERSCGPSDTRGAESRQFRSAAAGAGRLGHRPFGGAAAVRLPMPAALSATDPVPVREAGQADGRRCGSSG